MCKDEEQRMRKDSINAVKNLHDTMITILDSKVLINCLMVWTDRVISIKYQERKENLIGVSGERV